jgi:hypothetical protein
MHPSAKEQIVEYLTEFEAYATWMYLDSRGLVTTGIGILLDPYEKYGGALPWNQWYDKVTLQPVRDEGEVKAEFQMIKSKNGPKGVPVYSKDPAQNFANYKTFEPITRLRASEANLKNAVNNIVSQKEAACRQYFGPDYDRYPADVQVVLTQMSYAGGLLARKHELLPFLAAHDWLGAQEYTYLTNATQGKAGYKKYNACLRQLMMNAHIVESCSELSTPNITMPKDPTVFFGYKRALGVARWNSSDDQDTTIREGDIITSGDHTGWLRSLAKP